MIGIYISFGIISGAILAVAAIGLSLLLRTTGFRFLAYGDTMAVGAYMAYLLNARFGFDIYISMLVAILGTGLVGIILYWLVFRGLKGAGMATMLILTVGLAFLLRNLILLIFGPEPVSLQYPTQVASRMGPFLFNLTQLILISISVLAMLVFYILMSYTRIGKSIRAVGDDSNLAEVRGVHHDKVMIWAWFICLGLAGLSGTMLGMMGGINPAMGFQILLLAFSGMILGGIGNPYGAAAGGFLIGITSELTAAIGLAEYKVAVAYLLMALILLVKPKGLFPAK